MKLDRRSRVDVIPGNSNNASERTIGKLLLLTRCPCDRPGVINLMAGGQGRIGRTRDNHLKHAGPRHNSRNDVGFPDDPWQEANMVCGSNAGTPPTDPAAFEIQFVALILKF